MIYQPWDEVGLAALAMGKKQESTTKRIWLARQTSYNSFLAPSNAPAHVEPPPQITTAPAVSGTQPAQPTSRRRPTQAQPSPFPSPWDPGPHTGAPSPTPHQQGTSRPPRRGPHPPARGTSRRRRRTRTCTRPSTAVSAPSSLLPPLRPRAWAGAIPRMGSATRAPGGFVWLIAGGRW